MMAEVKLKLIRSLIGVSKAHIAILASLGLRKIGDVSVQPKNSATDGKLNKIIHMVEID